MGFLNPLLLLGAFAALIPLIIHLWSRRQARVVDFSSLMFLLAAHRKSVRRLQIKQWLILLLRMAIVALLAMAFARPLLKSQLSIAGARIHTSCVIVLDNSYSMRCEDITGNRFELAREQALAIAETLQRGDRASLILMSDRANVIFPQLTTDLAQLAEAIREATVSARTTSIQTGVEAATTLLTTSTDPNKEIYLITDLTRNAWATWEQPRLPAGVRLFLAPVGESDVPNASIEEIQVSNPLMGVGIPVELEAAIRNHDAVAPQDITLSLFVNDLKQSETGLHLEVGDTARQNWTYHSDVPGYHTGYFETSADRLEIDNRRYFSIWSAGDIRVLVVGSDNPYLRLALQPDPLTDPRRSYLLLPTTVAADSLSTASVASYEILAISDLSRLSESDLPFLTNHVQNGGKLLVFLGDAVLNGRSLVGLMDAQIGQPHSFKSPKTLVLREPESSLFGATPSRYFTGEGAPQFYRAHEMTPGPEAQVLASFADNPKIPAILSDSTGAVLVINASLRNREWSNFPLSPIFVPLVQQSCMYLMQPQLDGSSILVGEEYTTVLRDAEGAQATLRPQGETEGETLTLDARRMTESTVIETPGIYQIDYTSQGTLQSRMLTVNVDTTESDLETYSVDEVMELLGNAHLLEDSQTLREQLSDYRTGREIWGQLIVLSLALMALELYLVNRGRSGA